MVLKRIIIPLYATLKNQKGRDMALPKFLLQVRDGQESNVYRWTEMLAKRKDMRPITGKEAKEILDRQQKVRTDRIRAMQEDLYVDGDDDFKDEDVNPITADPALSSEDSIQKPAEHPSFKTQETLLAEETAKITEFRTKGDLEIYFLEKYQIDMIAGNRENMNEQAIAIVGELSKHGKLFNVLNE